MNNSVGHIFFFFKITRKISLEGFSGFPTVPHCSPGESDQRDALLAIGEDVPRFVRKCIVVASR